ncbi:MAG: ABC transporter substrate-binding protein [Deltaproteobacteria bacterium RBG_19FT_COMBO_60_16]|nr:MAG: ABC transporter substrate-binding protein [Deltaproteobacteria bacterium RBG_16_64_85]OGP99704.1 MAG: ABC transporter substrate-binding protein [Deltaproteobacteria bacterium RBG_19FT_COMBO_60_16]
MGKNVIRVAALAACALFLMAGGTLAADIKVGHLADLTGPTSSVGNPYAKAVQDYKEYINSKGGINGKKIDMPMYDYAYDKNKAINQYKKYLEEKVVAVQGWGSGDTEALTGFLAQDKIPYLSASYSAHLTDINKAPYNFFIAADYTTQLRAGLKYIKDNWKEKRAPKVAFIYPNVPYGIAPIKGGKEYAKELGFEIVGDENVDLKAIEANSQMLSLKSKNADFAWIGGTTPSTAVVLKDAKKLGLKTKFFVNLWGNDEDLVKMAGDAADGLMGLQAASIYGENVPGMKLIKEITKGQHQNTHYIRGWVSMMVLCEALKIADKKGELNGPGVKAALETIKDYDTGGLTSKITFTPADHRPNMSAKIYEYEKGKMILKKTIELERKKEWLGL